MNLIFLSGTFKGEETGWQKVIKEKMEKLSELKKKSQPSRIKTCGSTFKNPTRSNTKKSMGANKTSAL